MSFNFKDFSLQEQIKKRINLEAQLKSHVFETQEDYDNDNPVVFQRPELPDFVQPQKPKRGIVGWYILFNNVLKELKP